MRNAIEWAVAFTTALAILPYIPGVQEIISTMLFFAAYVTLGGGW